MIDQSNREKKNVFFFFWWIQLWANCDQPIDLYIAIDTCALHTRELVRFAGVKPLVVIDGDFETNNK